MTGNDPGLYRGKRIDIDSVSLCLSRGPHVLNKYITHPSTGEKKIKSMLPDIGITGG